MTSISAKAKRSTLSQMLHQHYKPALPSSTSSAVPEFSINDYINYHTENEVCYEVEDEISSPATKVFFVRAQSPCPQIPICLKVWEPCDNGLYSTVSLEKCTGYLLEGLAFNRQFAKDVHLGIAPIEEQDKNFIKCGKLIVNPDANTLEKNVKYALIMRRLEQSWRLDYQLIQDYLDTEKEIEFLAQEIAQIHQLLPESAENIDGEKSISSKLTLNKRFFEDALKSLSDKNINIEKYKKITALMDSAYKKRKRLFQKRSKDHRIKRCHGDLKTTNLWVCPSSDPKEQKQLVALDCVDFNPEFCYIDTLSDVAMLVIDIEMHLPNWPDESNRRTKNPGGHFLDTYLNAIHEKKRGVRELLEYYMTEKAMIYAYMCILFDKCNDDNGKKYLDLALAHALKLAKQPAISVKSLILRPFASLHKIQQELTGIGPHALNLPFASLLPPKKMMQDHDQASRPNK